MSQCTTFSLGWTVLTLCSVTCFSRNVLPAHAQERATLKHDQPISSLAFSPDGKLLAVGIGAITEPGQVKVWDMATSREQATLEGYSSGITALGFSPDGKVLAAASVEWPARKEGIAALVSHPRVIVKLYDATTQREQRTLSWQGGIVSCVAFAPTGEALATGGQIWSGTGKDVGQLKVWMTRTGQERASVRTGEGMVTSLAFAPDDRTLAVGSSSSWKLINTDNWLDRFSFTEPTWALAFSPDSQMLAIAGGNLAIARGNSSEPVGTLKIVDLVANGLMPGQTPEDAKRIIEETGRQPTLRFGTRVNEFFTSVTFAPDGTIIAAGSIDGTLCIWNFVTGQVQRLRAHSQAVSSVAFAPIGRVLASGSADRTVKLWDVDVGSPRIPAARAPDTSPAPAGTPRKMTYKDGVESWNRCKELWEKAHALRQEGNLSEAISLYEQGVAEASKWFGKERAETAAMFTTLGTAYREIGDYWKSEPLLKAAAGVWDSLAKADWKESQPRITITNQRLFDYRLWQILSEDFVIRHSLSAAQDKYDRFQHMREVRGGQARVLYELGMLYTSMGDLHKAESSLKESANFGTALEHSHALAELYLLMGDGEAALAELKRRSYLIPVGTKKKGLLPPQRLGIEGRAHAQLGRYEQAAALLEESTRSAMVDRGSKVDLSSLLAEYELLTNTYALSEVYVALEEYGKAEECCRLALDAVKTKFGAEHPMAAVGLTVLGTVHAASKRWSEALEAMDESRHIMRSYADRLLSAMSQQDQLSYLYAYHKPSLERALSLALVRRSDEDAVALSSAWVLNGKAIALQVLTERTQLARESQDPKVAELVEIRKNLAHLSLKGSASAQAELSRLAANEQELSKQLGVALGRPSRDDPWVQLAEVREALPADSILIEIAKLKTFDFPKARSEKPDAQERYLAWLIPPKNQGQVELIDLGAAADIEAAVAAFRTAMKTAESSIKLRGEAAATTSLQPYLDTVARLVLRPLESRVAGCHQWLLSPDGALWLVPWEALPLADGRYAVEKQRISYLVSGRELATGGYEGRTGPSLVMANPDFNLSWTEAVAETKRFLDQQRLAQRGSSERSHDLREMKWLKLLGTETEAKAIAPNLTRFAGLPPSIYTGRQALEGIFKAVSRPKVVVLSTHGFFLEDQPHAQAPYVGVPLGSLIPLAEPSEPRTPGRTTIVSKAIDNPLLRCGLVLAGANDLANAQPGSDDGILTGLEIVGTDLRGTDLVVLSACETAVGQIQNGEGVAGLRQAFQLAGAKTIVATLWKIPDAETATLMSTFFEGLAAGQDKLEALRRAQLTMIQDRRRQHNAAHPYYWAAFTLTGEWTRQ